MTREEYFYGAHGIDIEKAKQAKTGWIPVSERLPETNDEVLVTYVVNQNDRKRYVETASYWSESEDWSSVNDEYRLPNTRIDIVAWMSLPEPYKAESEDEE